LTHCLLKRNLISKAADLFESIDTKEAKKLQMLYDYTKVFLAFHTGKAKADKEAKLAKKYTTMELPASVKKKWEEVQDQIAQANKKENAKDPSSADAIFLKDQQEAKRKAAQPFLDFTPQDDHTIVIEHRNISEITINFYRTDLELLFSMQPFQEENVSYRLMIPNLSETVPLEEDGKIRNGETVIQLPDLLRKQNTIVEMLSGTGDLSVRKVHFDNEIDVQVSQDIGEIRVLESKSRQPKPGAYCKVYGQNIRDHKHMFFKDGYTDVRGRFDYRTLSTDQIRSTQKLAILISTEKMGSIIKEIKVPLEFITKTNLFED